MKYVYITSAFFIVSSSIIIAVTSTVVNSTVEYNWPYNNVQPEYFEKNDNLNVTGRDFFPWYGNTVNGVVCERKTCDFYRPLRGFDYKVKTYCNLHRKPRCIMNIEYTPNTLVLVSGSFVIILITVFGLTFLYGIFDFYLRQYI